MDCSDWGEGVALKSHQSDPSDAVKNYINPSVCCPKDCGTSCNDCDPDEQQGMPNKCRFDLCDQTALDRKCCYKSIPHDKLCQGLENNQGCRLGKNSSFYYHIS